MHGEAQSTRLSVPSGSIEEVKIVCWFHVFPWIVSKKCGSEKRLPPGPPLEGYLGTHESAILGMPPNMFQAVIVKIIHEVVALASVNNTGKLPAEKDPVHSTVFSRMRWETRRKLFWLRGKHGPVPVPLECLLRGRDLRRTVCGYKESTKLLDRVVACDMFQEGGKWVYRCQGLSCNEVGQGFRCVDVVAFQTEDGKGRTGDLCAECWTANNGGNSSARSCRREQPQRRKRGGMEFQPFWDCWVEMVMRKDYMAITKDVKRVLKKRRRWCSLRADRGHAGAFRYKDDGTFEVHNWISNVQWNCFHGLAKLCKDGELEKEDTPAWTRKAIARIWQEALEDVEASNTNMNNIVWRKTQFS